MRGEVLVGPERRCRWSEDEKARIIEESLRSGAQIADIARRHGVSRSLLYTWRREARCAPAAPDFVPVLLSASEDSQSAPTTWPSRPTVMQPKPAIVPEHAEHAHAEQPEGRRFRDSGYSGWYLKSIVEICSFKRKRSNSTNQFM
jgi:transposase-like protein